MKGLLQKQFTFMIYGLVFWLPVMLVVYIGIMIVGISEKFGKIILGVAIPDHYLYTSLGTILCLLIVYFSGMLLKLTKIGGVLHKVPVIGLFFGQGEIITIAKLSHMQPCMFLNSSTLISYGWILSEEKIKLKDEKASFTLLNVYYPNVPTLVTGQVFGARKESVMKLANSSGELINLVRYAFRSPEALLYIPWEDESQEEFEERSKLFGIK